MAYRCRFCGLTSDTIDDFEVDHKNHLGFWCPDCDGFTYFAEEDRSYILFLEDKGLQEMHKKADFPVHVSPLRYPGGKSKLTQRILNSCRPGHMENFIEPFAGGASVGLALLLAGKVKNLYLNDMDYGIYSLFKVIKENPDELKACAEKLKEQKSVVQAYVMDEIFDKMGAGDALIAPYYAGDALTIMAENDSLNFVVPASGTNLFVDAMCIPAGAKQKEAAEMYINFMCEPDIAFANIDYICYSTPHSAAFAMLDEAVQNDPVSYPDQDFIAERTTVFVNLSNEANQLMQDLWTEMKSAEEETVNKWLMPTFLVLCLLAIIIILIRRYIKSKKDIF